MADTICACDWMVWTKNTMHTSSDKIFYLRLHSRLVKVALEMLESFCGTKVTTIG